jgi:hypothetical protein
MSYAAIDDALRSWARANGVTFATRYRDDEVRSFDIVDAAGARVQIWVNHPVHATVTVSAWDYRARKWTRDVPLLAVGDALTNAVTVARAWLNER